MENIYFIIGYKKFNIFRQYLEELLYRGFSDYSKYCKTVYLENIDGYSISENSLCVCVFQINDYYKYFGYVKKCGNIVILWDFEVIAPLYKTKGTKRFDLVNKHIDNDELDFVWVYDLNQIKYFSNEKVIYMPSGYCDGMFSNNIEKMYNSKILFYGNSSRRRSDLLQRIINRSERKFLVTWMKTISTVDWNERKNELSKYYYSIDIEANVETKECISISRITSLISSGVVLLSHNRLEHLGLKDGIDYFWYEGCLHALSILSYLRDNIDETTKISNNALRVIKANFDMKKLFSSFLIKNNITFDGAIK